MSVTYGGILWQLTLHSYGGTVIIALLIRLDGLRFGRAGEGGTYMAGKIVIDAECCKGCGLCVSACPKKCITMSARTNRKGFPIAESDNVGCTGCAICALMCPDAAIEVWRDEKGSSESQPQKPQMVKDNR